MSLPLLDRTKCFRRNIHQKQSIKPVFDIMFCDSLLSMSLETNCHFPYKYHSLFIIRWMASDLSIFPLSLNLSLMSVYCDVSVVARDKRVNMNDATQKHLHSAWLPASLSLTRTDRKESTTTIFCCGQPFSWHLVQSSVHIYLVNINKNQTKWFVMSDKPVSEFQEWEQKK